MPSPSPGRGIASILVICVVLLAYGCHGVVVDDLYVPGKHGHGSHLHGKSAWLMFIAFLAASAWMLAAQNASNGEAEFRGVARIAGWIAFGLFLIALLSQLGH